MGHREFGMWAIDTINPNAWEGAFEYVADSRADFVAVQEVRVEEKDKVRAVIPIESCLARLCQEEQVRA